MLATLRQFRNLILRPGVFLPALSSPDLGDLLLLLLERLDEHVDAVQHLVDAVEQQLRALRLLQVEPLRCLLRLKSAETLSKCRRRNCRSSKC
jgi:hypothetical protein